MVVARQAWQIHVRENVTLVIGEEARRGVLVCAEGAPVLV
ncbi:hypothetical protein SUDANB145_02404 [Streptomyces sp. enrichment culture]